MSNEVMEAIGPGIVGGLLPPADKPKLWCVRSQRSATPSSPVPLNPTHQNGADQVPPCPCIAARWLAPPSPQAGFSGGGDDDSGEEGRPVELKRRSRLKRGHPTPIAVAIELPEPGLEGQSQEDLSQTLAPLHAGSRPVVGCQLHAKPRTRADAPPRRHTRMHFLMKNTSRLDCFEHHVSHTNVASPAGSPIRRVPACPPRQHAQSRLSPSGSPSIQFERSQCSSCPNPPVPSEHSAHTMAVPPSTPDRLALGAPGF